MPVEDQVRKEWDPRKGVAFPQAGADVCRKFIFLLAWPLLGAGFCIFIAAYSVPTFDLTTNVVGIGSIAIGIVPYLSNRSRCL